VLVILDSSQVTSSNRVRLVAWTRLPSIWLLTPSGLMISPQSCARLRRAIAISPVDRLTLTSAIAAT
jgi:hypothetical protein